MTQRKKAFIAGGIVVVAIAALLAGATREEKLSDGDILVSTHDIPDSAFPKIRVEGVISAKPAQVWDIVRDCEASAEINGRVSESHIVERDGDDVICSETVDMPFPFSDMLTVTRWKFSPGPPVWKKTWTLVRGDFDYSNGSWTLREYDGGKTLAVYENHFHPQMKVPDWLARAFLKVGMPGLIKDLRKATE